MSHEVFSPELEFGRGCDLAIAEREREIVILAEVKESRLDWRRAQEAIGQLNECEERLRKRYPSYRFRKVLVHDKKGCRTFNIAISLLEGAGIEYMTTANSEEARRLRNLYRKIMRGAGKSRFRS